MDNSDKLRDAHTKWAVLKDDRATWEEDWKITAQQFLPRKCRFLEGDETNKGGIRTDIVDPAGILALRKLAAGMHGGMTSPARPWFRLTMTNTELAKAPKVKNWLDDTTKRMRARFARSNFYQIINNVYLELGAFGTAFFFSHPHVTPERPFGTRYDLLTVGEYALATNELGQVDTIGRTLQMTARQMVREFGYANCSDAVQREFDKPGPTTTRHDVIHLVYPRSDRDPNKIDAKNKRFASLWFEKGAKKKFLRESGYEQFPGFGPRWDVTGQDVYGGSPCMDILADCRMLQSMKHTTLKAEHKRADPPMVVPGSLKHPALLPGGVNVVDTQTQGNAVYAAQNVVPDTRGAMDLMYYTREQLREGLYNDLFAMISSSPTSNMTATQVSEMQEEKLLMLGPVIERLHTELFGPLIDREFAIMQEQGDMTEPPEEIQGEDLRVDFISLLAQAQKAVNTQAVDKFMFFINSNMETHPEFADVVDVDKTADEYAADLGVPISQLNTQDVRDEKRAERAEQAAALTNADVSAQAINMAQTAASTPTQGGNSTMLDDTMAGLGGAL